MKIPLFHPLLFLTSALCSVSVFLVTWNIQGQEQAAPTLASLKFQFDVQRAECWKPVRELGKKYQEQLHQLMDQVTESGDLDKALAVKAELDGFKNGQTNPAGNDFPELKRLQRIYAEANAKRAAVRNKKLETAMKDYRAKLMALQTRLTKEKKLDEALLVKAEIGKVDALAKEGPSGTTDPPGNTRSTNGVPVQVAKLVSAKTGAEEPVAEVVPFDAPRGDGRSGAKGILVKSEGGADRGSTWMFHYTRCASSFGLQIIHPRGRGQAIVHIRGGGIGISTPGDWRNVGYRGGSADDVRAKDAYEEVFPLENDREYAVVSRMDENGSCEVFIDDKLVATARAGSAKPLGLEIPEDKSYPGASGWGELEFKGEGLPMEWQEHWAGLLIGPLDGGTHACRDVRYGPGIAEVPE